MSSTAISFLKHLSSNTEEDKANVIEWNAFAHVCLKLLDVCFKMKNDIWKHRFQSEFVSKNSNLERVDHILQDFDMMKVLAKLSTDLLSECTKTNHSSRHNDNRCPDGSSVMSEPATVESRSMFGENKLIKNASKNVRIDYNEDKGRQVVAEKDIEAAEIVMGEKAFVSWLRPSLYSSYCHHCLQPLKTKFQCHHCLLATFCSLECIQEAKREYHNKECPYISILQYLSSGHLALRILVVVGFETAIERTQQDDVPLEEWKSKEHLADYEAMYSLMDHIEEKSYQLLFPDAVGAAFMAILANKMGFIGTNEIRIVASLLLKHISQVGCNVMSIGKDKVYETENLEKVAFFADSFEIGAGLYPTVCIMNHSCDANVVNSFSGNIAVSTALTNIDAGEELLVTYGPHFNKMSYKDRQRVLKKRFYFDCRCSACEGEKQNLSHALLCDECKGCLIINTIDCSSDCLDCGNNENVSPKLKKLENANICFLDYYKCIANGSSNEALIKMTEAYQILKDTVFESHELLILAKQELASIYEKRCRYNIALQFIVEVMDTFKKVHGEETLNYIQALLRFISISLSFAEHEEKGTHEIRQSFESAISLMSSLSKKETLLNTAKHLQVQHEIEDIVNRLDKK